METHADNGADLTIEKSSDSFHEMLDDDPETNKEMMENVHIPLKTKDESIPFQESEPTPLLQQCTSCNKLKSCLNKSSLSCNKFFCSECQEQNRSTNLLDEANDRSFDTINNQPKTDVFVRLKEDHSSHTMQELRQKMTDVTTQVIGKQKLCEPCTANEKSIPASSVCAQCENKFMCEPCGKHHNIQKSTRTHTLQDISKYVDIENAEVAKKQKMCEPCTATEKSIPACFFCAECENEFLCEPCGKHHNIQKSTRTHKLQDISQYVEAANSDTKNIKKLCEPCTANDTPIPACFFCVECENELLCESCGKHHNIQKSTRTHKLQDISHYMEAANADAKNIKKLCEPCTANEKSIPASFFCAECENELLCETCGKHHTLQKTSRTHKLQDISQYKEAAKDDTKNILKLFERCIANEQSIPASFFCVECENEFLCEPCGKHHTRQKLTRTHKLQDISEYKEASKTDAKNILKLCEPCTANEQSIPACFFCTECENEFLCEPCGKHHTKQKSTRTHKLQDISKYAEAPNAEVTKNQKLCEPCTGNEQSIPACFFCTECENEFLCEPCGKHHTKQKSTRTHKLQDISKYAEAPNAEVIKNHKLCEPCTANEQSIPACFFCVECENEFLCEPCGKHHTRQKLTRTHKLQDISKYVEDPNAEVTKNQKLCEPCTGNEKVSHACYFCSECENEFLCETCGNHHTKQKSTRTHKLQDISKYVEAPNSEVTKNQKLCEPCTASERVSDACYFCAECENEFLCETCGKHHTKQKSTRTHTLQNICKYVEVANAVVTDTQKLCEPGTVNEKAEKSTPGKPSASAVGSDTITLTWDKPSLFQKGDHFQIACREYKESRWKICYDNVEKNMFELTNLKSDAQFVFRIRAVYNDYESNYSIESDVVETRKSPASKLVCSSTSRSAADVLPIKYALPMTEVQGARNTIGKTKKFEIGSRSIGTWKEKTILLIGETGTGKSTLVDGMANFILGVNWNDEFRFSIVNLEDVERQKIGDQALSQTEWITCYTMHPQDGGRISYTINIIDTPGFGDTRGLQRDQEIVGQIRELFTVDPPQGVYIIDAVCFLIKAPDARLTLTQSYIFQSIMSLFGKDIENNICSLITFADGLDPPVKTALKASELPFGKCFTFNNSALFAKNTIIDSSSMSEMFWDMGLKSFRNFFEHLDSLPSTSLKLTSDVLNERHELEASVRNLEPLLDAGLVTTNELNTQIKCFEENKSIIADNKDFTYKVKTNKQLKKDLPVGEHITNCTHCHFSCHLKCTFANDADKRGCWAIDQTSGYCKICPNKCFWDKHVNTPYIFEYIVVEEQQTYSEMKKKYEEASGKMLNQEQLIAEIQAELNNVVETVDILMETYTVSKIRLADIALRPNPLTMKEHIDVLIENEKMVKKSGWLERIQTLHMYRTRADIDKNVSQFLMQVTSYVSKETAGNKNCQKDKRNIFVRGWNQFLKHIPPSPFH